MNLKSRHWYFVHGIGDRGHLLGEGNIITVTDCGSRLFLFGNIPDSPVVNDVAQVVCEVLDRESVEEEMAWHEVNSPGFKIIDLFADYDSSRIFMGLQVAQQLNPEQVDVMTAGCKLRDYCRGLQFGNQIIQRLWIDFRRHAVNYRRSSENERN